MNANLSIFFSFTLKQFGRYDQKGGLNSTPSSPFEMCRKAFLACCEEGQYVEMDEISECSVCTVKKPPAAFFFLASKRFPLH